MSGFQLSRPVVQVSLDLTSLAEALDTAAVAVEAGVDWIEAGTPLLLAEGLRAVAALHERFPEHPIVADLKTMDGGYLEAEMMARAGAAFVVVMAAAHDATVRRVVEAGHDFGVTVMGDNLAVPDRVAGARRLVELGVDVVIHHIGFDQRGEDGSVGPLDELAQIVDSCGAPVQAVGGLSVEQAVRCPAYGAPMVVIGAPLSIAADSFTTNHDQLRGALTDICQRVHQSSPRPPGGPWPQAAR
ncbi:MAG: orotidine 5'-phosphate decarboxylase [Propionibacteriaceae bacterium]|jgi:3-hexulose-6-phosphate synthase/6-phospho-3-hexuloisomerase|nr:orotidine 5'-phosphate decarboxylase [Propionibacteriaceae bacterium]